MNASVSTSVSQFTRTGSKVLVQNLGPGMLYVSFSSAVSATDGIQMDVFDAIELPGSTFGSIYMVSDSTADVRMLGGVKSAAAAPVAPAAGSITEFVGGNRSIDVSFGSFSFADFAQGIELSAAPTADVNYSVAYTSADLADITFYSGNPQTGTISAGSQSTPFSASGNYGGSNSSFTITATITLSSADTDFDGVTASYDIVATVPAVEYNGLDNVLVEGAGLVNFTWQDNTAPTSDVTVNYSSTNTDAAFTSGTITSGTTGVVAAGSIELVDNGVDENEIPITVTTSSADPNYDGLTLNVFAYDNPVLVTQPQFGPTQPAALGGVYIYQSQGPVTRDHALAFVPTADVVLVATVSGSAEAANFSVSPSTLTYTTGNFATPQTVTYSYTGSTTDFTEVVVTWAVDAASSDTSRLGDTDEISVVYDPNS